MHRFECRASILFSDSHAKVSLLGCCSILSLHRFATLLHTFAIAMKYTIQKVLFLDSANAKSLITPLKLRPYGGIEMNVLFATGFYHSSE